MGTTSATHKLIFINQISYHHRSTLAKSAMSLLVSQRRPFTQSYAALIRSRSSLIPLRTRHSESHLRKSFQKHTGPLQPLKLPRPDKRGEDVISQWKEFYVRARALCNKGPFGGGPIDFSQNSPAKVEEILQEMEKVEPYNFPKDGDPTLDAACEVLSVALQNASRANVEHDTTEVKQALDNLQKVYDEAAKSNTVLMRYIDVEPPCSPYSPLMDQSLKRILLARPWMKELLTGLHDHSLRRRILVIGSPGSGRSLGLSCF